MAESPRLSVVIPVRDEEQNVEELNRRLEEVLGETDEIIYVDDGSADRTWERLRALYQPGRRRLIRFRRNFGKTAALMAGLSAARGAIVFTMDGDLQDDPAEIPRFLAKLDEGYDLVSGWKRRRHDPLSKVVSSRIFNFAVRRTTGVDLHDLNCGFKAYRGEVARSLNLFGEMHRFIPLWVVYQGYQAAEVEVRHHPRRYGRSKYGMERALKGFLDLGTVLLLTRFAERPSHAFGLAALLLAAAGALSAGGHFLWTPAASLDLLAGVCWGAAAIVLGLGWAVEAALQAVPSGARRAFYLIEEQLD